MIHPGPPPASLPLRHLAAASIAVLIAGLALLARGRDLAGWDFDARFALGLTHCLTLGAVAQAIFGVWTQMLPVHGGAPLASARLSAAAWWALTLGAIVFVGQLWWGAERYWIGAALAAVGVWGELAVLGLTHARAARRDWAGTHFSAAMLWLAVLSALGLALAFDRQRGAIFPDGDGALVAHVHSALVGFGAMTVYGAGYRLLPWVGRERLAFPWVGRACFVLTNAGLAGLVIDSLFLGHRLAPLWAGLLILGFLAYALSLRGVFSLSGGVDAPTATALLSFAGGALWCALGAGLAWGAFRDEAPARAAYVFAAAAGTLVPLILSQLRRVGPVVAWHGIALIVGPSHAPTIERMIRPGTARWELAGCALTLAAGPAGFLLESPAFLRLAGAGLALAGAASAWNLAGALTPLLRARRAAAGA